MPAFITFSDEQRLEKTEKVCDGVMLFREKRRAADLSAPTRPCLGRRAARPRRGRSQAGPRHDHSLTRFSFILGQTYSNSLLQDSSPHVSLHILADPLLFPCPPALLPWLPPLPPHPGHTEGASQSLKLSIMLMALAA